jgi:hypothetical protein
VSPPKSGALASSKRVQQLIEVNEETRSLHWLRVFFVGWRGTEISLISQIRTSLLTEEQQSRTVRDQSPTRREPQPLIRPHGMSQALRDQ